MAWLTVKESSETTPEALPGMKFGNKQDSKDLNPRPLPNAPKNFNSTNVPKTFDSPNCPISLIYTS